MKSFISEQGAIQPKAEEKQGIRVFADDWKDLWTIESMFILATIMPVVLLCSQLEVCSAWTPAWLQEYCDRPIRALWSAYFLTAVIAVIGGLLHNFRARSSWELLSKHVLVSPDFYKILFDGLKNSGVAIAVSAAMMHVVHGLQSPRLHSPNAWYVDLVTPALPDEAFLAASALGWLFAAVLLYAANLGMRTAYLKFAGDVASARKIGETPMLVFRRSLLSSLYRLTSYNLFMVFVVLALFQLKGEAL
ncbi:hypothetical protein [Paraburkholderia sp. BR14374]|uniref:hypothetical protein n=1 Tax=Paraburkholderia sp. BR14374 TaxID=3237007 RepID=UPI0034CE1787